MERNKKQFKESLTTAVFTTKFVINNNSSITYVTHEENDGDWVFLSADEFEHFEDVVMIVGLGQILERDNSLLELADMPEGYCAERESKESKWVIRKNN
jgi:hypothetical protein